MILKERKNRNLRIFKSGIGWRENNFFTYRQKDMSKSGVLPFRFASFSQATDEHVRKFADSAPEWRTISAGLNLEGTCKNKNCKAMGQKVWSPLGYGQFHLSEKVRNTPCVLCKKNLKKVECAGIWKCDLIGRGRKVQEGNQTSDEESEDPEEKRFEYVTTDKKSCLVFGRMHKEIIQWYYLVLKSSNKFKCPKNHDLEEYQEVGTEWNCCKCYTTYQKFERSKSCKKCSYHVCYNCL